MQDGRMMPSQHRRYMKTLIIRRVTTSDQGTFGVLVFENIPFAVTLEREWLDNRPSVGDVPGSCIPDGEYICKRVNSPRFGDTFEVTNVFNRSHILFHKGNLEDDSRGCILVGEEFGTISGESGIRSSKSGYNEFKAILRDDIEFRLLIVDDWQNPLV